MRDIHTSVKMSVAPMTGRVINLIFKDMLHCPSLSHNLMSIGRLDESGCYAVVEGRGVTFINPEGCPFMWEG